MANADKAFGVGCLVLRHNAGLSGIIRPIVHLIHPLERVDVRMLRGLAGCMDDGLGGVCSHIEQDSMNMRQSEIINQSPEVAIYEV